MYAKLNSLLLSYMRKVMIVPSNSSCAQDLDGRNAESAAWEGEKSNLFLRSKVLSNHKFRRETKKPR